MRSSPAHLAELTGREERPNILSHFRQAMESAGIITGDTIIPDGRLHRIYIEGQRRGSRNGAYVLHGDGRAAGWYQNFVTGVTGTWRMSGGHWEIDPTTRRLIEESKKARKVEQDQRNAKKAAEACRIWDEATHCTEHPYLTRKGVKAHGLRISAWKKWVETDSGWKQVTVENSLLIPIISPDNELVNVQAIFPETHQEIGRDKDYLGGRKKGCLFWLGEPTETILIAEGYATAASLHENTGHQTIVAFDAGNLSDVALTIRKAKPDATIILCGDNDRRTPGNPGLTKAREAALSIKGLLSVPSFASDCNCTDWNDWYQFREAHAHG